MQNVENDCPASSMLRKILTNEVTIHQRKFMEAHLHGCDACVELLGRLAADWSLEGQMSPRAGLALGPETMAMLARMALPVRPSPPAGENEALIPPEIDGLADWKSVGRGGMGVVFRAREVELDRPVAVKVLSPDGRLAPSSRGRAVREALLMASLRHPNVVQVYRSGEVEGLPFLVMEWIDGGTLQDRINDGPLSCREAAETVHSIAAGVSEAHALGIIHRDLKPANVLLAVSGQVGPKLIPKLGDFGLARRGDGDGMTEAGIALGTPGYMAPEQTGMNSIVGEVGPATDVHGLGAILHACITGRAPYEGPTSWEKLVSSARGTPTSVRNLRRDAPRDLTTIIEKCLQPSPSRRYRSAGEVADDLGRFLDGRPVSARPITVLERGFKWARRRPGLAASAALLTVAALGVIAGTAYHVASITRALRELSAEQDKSRAALSLAVEARDQASQTLSSLSDDVVGRLMTRGGVLNEDDRLFLVKIRNYYAAWSLDPDPEASLRFRGAGLGRLGDLLEQVHWYEDASLCRRAAIEVYDEAIRRGFGGPELIQQRLKAMVLLHQTLGRANRHVEAEAIARRLIDFREPLSHQSKFHARNLALDYIRLGEDLAAQQRQEEADASFQEGLARLERLQRETPNDPFVLEAEMRAFHITASRSKNAQQGEAIRRKLVGCAEGALAIRDLSDEYRDKFIRYQTYGLSDLVAAIYMDRPEEAMGLHGKRMNLARELVSHHPNDPVLRGDLLHGAAQLYDICARLGRPFDAESELEIAVESGGRMIAAEPAVFDRARIMAFALKAYAMLFEATGRQRRAVEQLDRIADIFDPWTKMKDRTSEVVPEILKARRRSAKILSELGDHREAARRLALILELCEKKERAKEQLSLASELLAAGDHRGARKAAQQAATDPDILAEATGFLNSLATESVD